MAEEQHDRLAAQVRRMADMLRAAQWAGKTVNRGTNFVTDVCPWCGGIQPGTFGITSPGHKPDCALMRVLVAVE
jgi:hypothetical protein